MRIGIVGGTGKLGRSLGVRWALAGHSVALGSRHGDKALALATKLSQTHGASLGGMSNDGAVRQAEVVILTVPYGAHHETLASIKDSAQGKVVIDATVPLAPPRVDCVHVPAGQAAALEAQAILGPATPVAAAFHHVSAAHLADPAERIECDVLVAADDAGARATAVKLIADLGLRGLDAGPLANAVALESLTPVLIHLNRTYKSKGAGVVFTDLTG